MNIEEIYEKYGNRTLGETQMLILFEILETLKAMKKQEFDYWEAWKIAKNKEQKKE